MKYICFHPTMVLAQRCIVDASGSRRCRFHPTMVLAQLPLWFSLNGYEQKELVFKNGVSIPLWFSLNEFLYVYTSTSINVSIPLWFSLNRTAHPSARHMASRFHPTMVLAQPEAEKTRLFHLGFHPTMVLAQRIYIKEVIKLERVSIPLWFSLNKSERRQEDRLQQFPSHYGSRSTRAEDGIRKPIFKFPSHYGSRSTRSERAGD